MIPIHSVPTNDDITVKYLLVSSTTGLICGEPSIINDVIRANIPPPNMATPLIIIGEYLRFTIKNRISSHPYAPDAAEIIKASSGSEKNARCFVTASSDGAVDINIGKNPKKPITRPRHCLMVKRWAIKK